MDDIYPGQRVWARDAFQNLLPRVAVTGIEQGLDFPVIWVAHEDEWEQALAEGRDPDALPWPFEDVTPRDEDAHAAAS